MDTLAINEAISREDVLAGVWQIATSDAERLHVSDRSQPYLDASGLPLKFADGRPVREEQSAGRSLSYGVKHVMDVVLGSAALIALGPLLIILALIIRLTSPGAALSRQDRDGLNGKVISIYKFRSMFADRGDVIGVAQTKKRGCAHYPCWSFYPPDKYR